MLSLGRLLVNLEVLCGGGGRSRHSYTLVNSIFGSFYYRSQTQYGSPSHHVVGVHFIFPCVHKAVRENCKKPAAIGMPSSKPARPSSRLISVCSVCFQKKLRNKKGKKMFLLCLDGLDASMP